MASIVVVILPHPFILFSAANKDPGCVAQGPFAMYAQHFNRKVDRCQS